MTKQNKIIVALSVLLAVFIGYVGYTEGMKFYQAEKNKWANAGAFQMRELIFQNVSKGDVQISNVKGDQTITIGKK